MSEVSNRSRGGSGGGGGGRLANVPPRDFFDEIAHQFAVVVHPIVENPGELGSDRRHGLERCDHFDKLGIHDRENAASDELSEKDKKTERKRAEKPAWSARSPGGEDYRKWRGVLEERGMGERKAGGTSRREAKEGSLPHRESRGRKSSGPFLGWLIARFQSRRTCTLPSEDHW